jgi:5'-nucleotidase
MRKERIIIDMDEVMADTMGDMIDWYSRQYEQQVDKEKMLVGSWVKGFPDEHQQLIRQRLLSEGFFRNLPVMKDAVDVIRELNEKYEVFICSAATEFPNSLKDKLEWLLDHFPYLSWKQLVLCGDKRLINGDYMIDDHVRNLEVFCGKPYLFTSWHNLNVEGYDRIDSWAHAAEIFLNSRP